MPPRRRQSSPNRAPEVDTVAARVPPGRLINIYQAPTGFTWEPTDTAKASRLNVPPHSGFPSSKLPILMGDYSVTRMTELTWKALRICPEPPLPRKSPLATVTIDVADRLGARATKASLTWERKVTARKPRPPPPVDPSLTAPQEQSFYPPRWATLAAYEARFIGIPKDIVITFVEELDKAKQYVDFSKYMRTKYPHLKHNHNRDDLSYDLTKDNEKTNKFNLLIEDDILRAVTAYIRELKEKWLNDCKLLQASPENNTLLPTEANIQVYVPENEIVDEYALRNPVYYLDFQAREEGYVLDQNPEKELEKLKKFAPMFYRNDLACREPPVELEARTVIVSNVSHEVTEKEIRSFFRMCGFIESVETTSAPEGQIAHITFTDIPGAKCAQTYSGARRPGLSKLIEPSSLSHSEPLPVQDANVPSYEHLGPSPLLKYAPLVIQLKDVQDSKDLEAVTEKAEDINSMYGEALKKYSVLRKYYYQFESKHVKADIEGYGRLKWLTWMAMESLGNGGYTVGGRVVKDRPMFFSDTDSDWS